MTAVVNFTEDSDVVKCVYGFEMTSMPVCWSN